MDVFKIASASVMILFNMIGTICALIFIITVIIHRQCHTTTILLVCNSAIAGLISNTVAGIQGIYQLFGDNNDSLCILRGHLFYTVTGLLYHTLCVQALHRLVVTVFSGRRYLQSKGVITIAVIIQWTISLSFTLPILLNHRISYDVGSHLCSIAINDLFAFLYLSIWIYFSTMFIITVVYVSILRHMRKNSFFATDRQQRAEKRRQLREIRLYFRIILLIAVLFIMGIPYCVFFALSMINSFAPSPPYAGQLCFVLVAMGYGISMLLCLLNTDDVRKLAFRLKNDNKENNRQGRRHRRIRCATTQSMRLVDVPPLSTR